MAEDIYAQCVRFFFVSLSLSPPLSQTRCKEKEKEKEHRQHQASVPEPFLIVSEASLWNTTTGFATAVRCQCHLLAVKFQLLLLLLLVLLSHAKPLCAFYLQRSIRWFRGRRKNVILLDERNRKETVCNWMVWRHF